MIAVPPAPLILFDRLEESAKIAFAESIVPFALENFEEDGSNDRLGKNLQQDSCIRAAIDQNMITREAVHVLAVGTDAFFQAVI